MSRPRPRRAPRRSGNRSTPVRYRTEVVAIARGPGAVEFDRTRVRRRPRVGGVAPREPGYRSIDVRPLVGGGLTYGEASRRTAAGMCRVRWDRVGDDLRLRVETPRGVPAFVKLPDRSPVIELTGGSHELRCDLLDES